MPIKNIPSANSQNVGSYTLLIGEDLPLYSTPTGFFATNTTGPVFGMPPQSSIPRGTLWVEAVGIGTSSGTAALSLQLVVSFDGGVTFQPTGAAVAAVAAGVFTLVSFNVSGLGGNGQMALVSSGIALGTGPLTGFNIYAHLG